MNSTHNTPVQVVSGRSGVAIELIKATAWPVAILVIFFFLKGPLLLALSEIPSLIRSAQNLTVGSVSISLRSAGIQDDVRKGLSKVSRDGLRIMLGSGVRPFGYLSADWESNDSDRDALKELQADNLITITPSPPGEAYPFQYRPTPGAKRAYDVLLAYLVAQLAEVPASGNK
jgi:hypothetical protein